MKSEQFGETTEGMNLSRHFHFEDIELTPGREFSFDVHVRKEPIEIHSGDKLGANSVEVTFEAETAELLKEAEKLQALPEETRLQALVDLVRAKLQFPYSEVIQSAQEGNPDLREWFERRFGKNPDLVDLELNEFLSKGYGDCKIFAAAYLVAAQAAKLKGIYGHNSAAHAMSLKNIQRPDNREPIFRSAEVDRDLRSGHAWVEIRLSDGKWVPVDPATNMVGLGKMLETFKRAGYKIPIVYSVEKLSPQLELDSTDSFFEPGEAEKDLHAQLKIGKDFMTRKINTDKYKGNVELTFTSVQEPKNILLNFGRERIRTSMSFDTAS